MPFKLTFEVQGWLSWSGFCCPSGFAPVLAVTLNLALLTLLNLETPSIVLRGPNYLAVVLFWLP